MGSGANLHRSRAKWACIAPEQNGLASLQSKMGLHRSRAKWACIAPEQCDLAARFLNLAAFFVIYCSSKV